MADHNDVGTGSNVSGGGISVIQPQGPTYYLGTWDASTNTPTLTSSVAPAGPSGSYYIVSVAGTTTLNGISDWSVGDWVIWSGSVWQKLEGGKTSVTVGSTLIAGGSAGNVLYDNGGTLGEYTITGTAGSVVMSASPTLTGSATITGGTVTADAPPLNITQTWNGAGGFTAMRVNITNTSSSSASYFFDYQLAGVSTVYCSRAGTFTSVNSNVASSGTFGFGSRSILKSSADGYVELFNNAATGFTGLRLGGTTVSFPMIKTAGANIEFKTADDSGYVLASASGFAVRGSGSFYTANASVMTLGTDGYAIFRNNAGTDFTGIRLGGFANTFPMLKKNSTSLETKLADDSAYSNHSALSFTSTGSTWANIPAAGSAGRMQFVSNAGTKGSMWLDDGTRWKPINGQCLLASLDTTSASIGSTETIVFQYQLPANLWQTSDIIRVQYLMEKTGVTDTGIAGVRIGTAGTSSDTAIVSTTALSAASRTGLLFLDIRLESATSALQVSSPSGYGTTSTFYSAITISSASANPLYVSLSIRSGGATDTVTCKSGLIQLISKAN